MGWKIQGSIPGRHGDFSLENIQASCGVHPASCLIGTGAPSLDIKWSGHDTDSSSPFSAEVKSELRYNFTHSACIYVMYWDDITFTFAMSLVITDLYKTSAVIIWHHVVLTVHGLCVRK
jgi:hypothetical protein